MNHTVGNTIKLSYIIQTYNIQTGLNNYYTGYNSNKQKIFCQSIFYFLNKNYFVMVSRPIT